MQKTDTSRPQILDRKRLKIVVVCDVLGDANNGTTITALNLISFLQEMGHDVKIVCPDKEKEGLAGWYVVPTLNFGIFNSYVERNNVKLAKPDKTIVQTAIKNSDVIHVMMPFSLGKAVIRMARRFRIPVTCGFHCQAENITCHFGLHHHNMLSSLIYKNFYYSFYRHAAAIHYPTEFIRDEFEKHVQKNTPAFVISNGVNPLFTVSRPNLSENPKNCFTIVFAGRLSREKEHCVLIDAVKKSRYEKNIQLIFAGAGPLKENLLKYGAGLTNPLHIDFYGREALAELFHSADLYCHPASVEIEAISCLEAISCGLIPVIANSPKSATKYFALNEDHLFETGDSSDLARKIDYWIENPEKKQQAQQLYAGYSTRFHLNNCMQSMEEMFYAVVQNPCSKEYRTNLFLPLIKEKIGQLYKKVVCICLMVVGLFGVEASYSQTATNTAMNSQLASNKTQVLHTHRQTEPSNVSSLTADYYDTHILKMHVSRFYNVPSYWFEQGSWNQKDELT